MDFETYKRRMMPTVTDEYSELIKFGYMLFEEHSFRNVMLNRLHRNPILYVLFRVLFKPVDSLYISMPPEKIGGGVFFQHGFSTILLAESVGENCSFNQQVTVGARGMELPIIGDNVTVYTGAIVIGKCILNEGSVVGTGAVVVHDVPANTTVVGVPAHPVNNLIKKIIL